MTRWQPQSMVAEQKIQFKRFDCIQWKTAIVLHLGCAQYTTVGCPKLRTSAQRSRSRRFRSGWHDSNNTWNDEWTDEQRRSKQLTYRVVTRAIIFLLAAGPELGWPTRPTSDHQKCDRRKKMFIYLFTWHRHYIIVYFAHCGSPKRKSFSVSSECEADDGENKIKNKCLASGSTP